MAVRLSRLADSLRARKKAKRNRVARAELLEPRLAPSGVSLLQQLLASAWHSSPMSIIGPVAPRRTVVVNPGPTIVTPAAAASSVVTGTSTSLSVLGGDSSGQANLTYTWSSSSATGTSPPTFSVNGTNAARNEVVTFKSAGVYTFTVRIADNAGLSVASSVVVTVSPTATSVLVTPSAANLSAGASQQFAAVGLDQFGAALATQPTFTWTASVGSMTSTGLFTAPAAAGSVLVTATSGTLTGSVVVGVNAPSNFLGLTDSALASLTQSLFVRDGAITRNDMLQILQSVVQDGSVVDAAEFGALRTIVADATALNMPNYVQVLAADVVDGNVANAHFQGQSLGNLAVGSTVTQLSDLIGKWFLGTDHPTASGYAYTAVSGTLFGSGPTYTDMLQGNLGDCYFISAVGTIAKSSPAAIENMFIANGDNTWTVRFYTSSGVADYVTVDAMLPTSYGNLIFANEGASPSNAADKLWLPLLEKAYAQWNETGNEGRDGQNAYASMAGGFMNSVDAQVLNRPAQFNTFSSNADEQALIAALAANKAVTAATFSNPGNGLVGGHAYGVIGYNASTGMFTLYNPWGPQYQPAPLSWSQLQASCQAFVIADASSTTPASLTPAHAAAVVQVAATARLNSQITDAETDLVSGKSVGSEAGPSLAIAVAGTSASAGPRLDSLVQRVGQRGGLDCPDPRKSRWRRRGHDLHGRGGRSVAQGLEISPSS